MRKALTQFQEHYHEERNRQGKNNNVLLFRALLRLSPVGDVASAVENVLVAYSDTTVAPHEYFDQTGGDPNYLNAQVPNPFEGLLDGHENQRPHGRGKPTVAAISGIHRRQRHRFERRQDLVQLAPVAVRKGYAHGLTFSANYTFSKNIQATSYANPQDATPTRVLTAFDRPQRLAFSPSYEFSVLGGAFSTRQTESHGAWSADGRLW